MPARISILPSSAMENGFHDKLMETNNSSPAFRILQKDNLESSLPILQLDLDDDDDDYHHNNNDDDDNVNFERASARTMTLSQNNKNNFQTRRRISKSNDHLVLASLQSHQTNPLRIRQQSKSHGNLQNDDNIEPRKSSMILSTEDFNEVLNAKLRRIQEQEEGELSKRSSRRTQSSDQVIHPKPFFTTVKTGEFLMPPPEVAALLGITPHIVYGNPFPEINDETDFFHRTRFRHLASINKKPEVRHSSHNARCQAALKATEDFYYLPMNASSITTASSMDERSKRMRQNNFFNSFPQTPRALPKHLEPIEGTMKMLPIRGDHSVPFGNIMFDRRVARGSNFASAPGDLDGESQAMRHAETRKREMARRKVRSQASKAMLMRIGSPPPVPGRKHEPVQTDHYLEELFEKPDELEAGTQTDHFVDRPATPLFCPKKIGQDASTQIEAGELFDYDIEVQPILEVLVGKTIEQALLEVLEEEEIAALKEQQRRFSELRAAEKAEAQRLEEQDKRIREEKDRRVKEHEDALKVQQETEDRVAASVLLTGYIAELLPAVLEGLKMSGVLLDEIKADVEEGFMPWLMKEVKQEVGSMIESRELLVEIIKEILENRAETYRRLGEEYDAAREARKLIIENDENQENISSNHSQESVTTNSDGN
ncbi:radial spoke head protein 3 homolog B isoform X2 [Leptopilina boulardi]|uniref:radial spoke head protein 3 homolog B isoform X2 n=1 Tax=Leptopilina boulardi TaxID=63433 RepID=UPI0021F67DC5|nr:radial spoke head protein 3 homolog B isoform X2 [Leptopilina boulardi]